MAPPDAIHRGNAASRMRASNATGCGSMGVQTPGDGQVATGCDAIAAPVSTRQTADSLTIRSIVKTSPHSWTLEGSRCEPAMPRFRSSPRAGVAMGRAGSAPVGWISVRLPGATKFFSSTSEDGLGAG